MLLLLLGPGSGEEEDEEDEEMVGVVVMEEKRQEVNQATVATAKSETQIVTSFPMPGITCSCSCCSRPATVIAVIASRPPRRPRDR